MVCRQNRKSQKIRACCEYSFFGQMPGSVTVVPPVAPPAALWHNQQPGLTLSIYNDSNNDPADLARYIGRWPPWKHCIGNISRTVWDVFFFLWGWVGNESLAWPIGGSMTLVYLSRLMDPLMWGRYFFWILGGGLPLKPRAASWKSLVWKGCFIFQTSILVGSKCLMFTLFPSDPWTTPLKFLGVYVVHGSLSSC